MSGPKEKRKTITKKKMNSELARRNDDCRNDPVRAIRGRPDVGTNCWGQRRCPWRCRRIRRNRNRWSSCRIRCATIHRRCCAADAGGGADGVANPSDPALPSWQRPTGHLGFRFRTTTLRNCRVLHLQLQLQQQQKEEEGKDS